MHHFVVKFLQNFLRLERQEGIDPSNQNPADVLGLADKFRPPPPALRTCLPGNFERFDAHRLTVDDEVGQLLRYSLRLKTQRLQ